MSIPSEESEIIAELWNVTFSASVMSISGRRRHPCLLLTVIRDLQLNVDSQKREENLSFQEILSWKNYTKETKSLHFTFVCSIAVNVDNDKITGRLKVFQEVEVT